MLFTDISLRFSALILHFLDDTLIIWYLRKLERDQLLSSCIEIFLNFILRAAILFISTNVPLNFSKRSSVQKSFWYIEKVKVSKPARRVSESLFRWMSEIL